MLLYARLSAHPDHKQCKQTKKPLCVKTFAWELAFSHQIKNLTWNCFHCQIEDKKWILPRLTPSLFFGAKFAFTCHESSKHELLMLCLPNFTNNFSVKTFLVEYWACALHHCKYFPMWIGYLIFKITTKFEYLKKSNSKNL